MANFTGYRSNTNGLLCQANGDQGDTACRTGVYYTLLAVSGALNDDLGRLAGQGFKIDLDKLTVSDGVFCRAPDGTWHAFYGNFTRDQHSQLILAAAAFKDKKSLWNTVKRFPLRLFFHQNTYDDGPNSKRVFPDIMSPGELTTILRGVYTWWLAPIIWPMLMCLDAVLCLDNYFRLKSLWDADNLIAARLMFDLKNTPTPFTFLNKYLYRKSDYKARILNNYSLENNGVVPLGELYVQIASEQIG